MNKPCPHCGRPTVQPGERLCPACRLQSALPTPGELYAAFAAQLAERKSPDLDALCAAHPQQAAELRRLHETAQAARGGRHPGPPSRRPAETSLESPAPDSPFNPWPQGSRYRIEGIVARGGMGIIYAIRDRELNRTLAMKVIGPTSPGQTPIRLEELPPAWVERFVEEAQITAQLDHPGIVPVHEIGLDPQGRLYFTMKLVQGQRLGDVFRLAQANQEGWNLARAIRALLQAAQAVAHAHEHGVIHRDLKPDNIMVGRLGEVYVMDWGVARAADRLDLHELRPALPTLPARESSAHPPTASSPGDRDGSDSPRLVTLDGTVLGTPAYMSPEHAHGRTAEIGPASDVYSLGAILYELLTGQPPYLVPGTHSSAREILEKVRAGPPTSIRRLGIRPPAELVAICDRAMDRNPQARYRNALELVEDLRAWLDHRVVKAHRTGALAELKAWILRNPLAAASQAAAGILIVAGLVGVIALQNRASRRILEGQAATERSNLNLRESLYRANILRAAHALQDDNPEIAKETLQLCEPPLRAWEWHHFRRHLPEFLIVPTLGASWETRMVWSHDDRWLVGIGWDRTLRVWNAQDATPRHPPIPLPEIPFSLALAPDDSWVAVGNTNGSLCRVDLATRSIVWTTPALGRRVSAVAMSPDGHRLVSGNADGDVTLWDAASGQPLAKTPLPGSVLATAFSPDGSTVLICSQNRPAHLLAADSLQVIRLFGNDLACPQSAAFSPDGTLIATADHDGHVRRWNAATGEPLAEFDWAASDAPLWSVAWSPDGSRIAAASGASLIRLWNARTGRPESPLRTRARGWLPTLHFSHDSRRLLASAEKGGIAAAHVWKVSQDPAVTVVAEHRDRVWSAAFTPDSRQLVTAGFDGLLHLVNAASGQILRTFRGHTNAVIWSVAVTPDQRHAVSGGQDGTVRVWDLESGTETRTLRAQPYPAIDNNVTLFVAISPDGQRVVSGGFDGHLQLWDLASGTRLWAARSHTNRLWSVAWSPDGRWIAAGSDAGRLALWESSTGRPLWQTNGLEGAVGTVAFHPDGRQLLTVQWAGHLRLWDPATGRLLARRTVSKELVRSAAYSPDARRIACAGFERKITLWDARTLEAVVELSAEPNNINCVAFSPDGKRLVSANDDHRVRIWQTTE